MCQAFQNLDICGHISNLCRKCIESTKESVTYSHTFINPFLFGITEFEMTNNLQENQELGSCTVYQKAVAVTELASDFQSDELKALGGLGVVAGTSVTSVEDGYSVARKS